MVRLGDRQDVARHAETGKRQAEPRPLRSLRQGRAAGGIEQLLEQPDQAGLAPATHVGGGSSEPLVEQPAAAALIDEGDAVPEGKLAVRPADGHAGIVRHIACTTIEHDGLPGVGQLLGGLDGFR